MSHESEIEITNEFINIRLQERYFTKIYWHQFDVIKILKIKNKWSSWKRVLRFRKFEFNFQFYSKYPNYNADLKYVTTLSINSRNFTENNIEKIIETLEIFASELKKLIIMLN
jgi:hypothetical protein